MNTTATATRIPKVVIFARPHLPIICPSCSNNLGIIDEVAIENRYQWAVAVTPINLAADDPHAEVNAIHGDCPHCRAALTALSVTYRRAGVSGEPREPQPPRLSIVLHGGAASGWAMIESRQGDTQIIEHLFEPRPARRLAGGIEYLREFLLADLPRPQAAENEIKATD